jgi:hypothetical protein
MRSKLGGKGGAALAHERVSFVLFDTNGRAYY